MGIVERLIDGDSASPAYYEAVDIADAAEVLAVAALATSADPEVRLGVVRTLPLLTKDEQPAAEIVATVIALTADPDRSVRDWACFALAEQWRDLDSPAVRDALAARVDDIDRGARSEALVGLAYRRDPRALPLVRTALERPSGTLWTLELVAAGALSDPSLHPSVLDHQAGWADPESVAVADAVRRLTDPDGPGTDVLAGVADLYRRRARDQDAADAAGWWRVMDGMLDIAPYRAPEFLRGVRALLEGDDLAVAELLGGSALARLADDENAR